MTRPTYANLLPVIFEGDIITFTGTGSTLYKVTRVKQVKLIAENEAGKRYEMRIQHCRKAENPEDFISTKPEVEAPTLHIGMAVRFRSTTKADQKGVFVVIGQGQGGWKVTRLGGADEGRYFYNLDAERLVPVDEINNADWS